jgi:hypothetical protein
MAVPAMAGRRHHPGERLVGRARRHQARKHHGKGWEEQQMPQRLAASDGMVFVEDGMFHLVDDAAEYGTASPEPLAPLTGPVTVASGTGLATFRSEIEANKPYVNLEYWSTEPPEPDGTWEVSVRDTLTVPGGRLTFASGVSMLGSSHTLTVPPGRYRLGAWCQGRAEARARESDAIDQGITLRGVERWLVRLWPDASCL